MRGVPAVRNGESAHRSGKAAGRIRGRESMSDRKGADGGACLQEAEPGGRSPGRKQQQKRDSGGDAPGGNTRPHTEHDG